MERGSEQGQELRERMTHSGSTDHRPQRLEKGFPEITTEPSPGKGHWLSIIHTGFNQRILRSDDSNIEVIILKATEIPFRILKRLQLWRNIPIKEPQMHRKGNRCLLSGLSFSCVKLQIITFILVASLNPQF